MGIIFHEMIFHEVPWKARDEKELLNNQLMFLAMAVNTKEEYINAIISFYQSKGIILKGFWNKTICI